MKMVLILLLLFLIPVADATAPVISSLVDETPQGHTCRIKWSTDILTDNVIKYSTNSDMSAPKWSNWMNDTTSINYITLFNLQLNTTYYWQAFSYNASDSSNSSIQNFVALPNIIRKNTSVEIVWDTNDSATTGQIEYGLNTNYGNLTDIDELSYWHPIEITGLTQGTTYYYRIREKDYKNENEAISDNFTFTTRTTSELENLIAAARTDNGTPCIYYVKPNGNNANNGLSIDNAWETPLYAASQSDVGDIIYVVNGSYLGIVDFGHYVGQDGIPEAHITMKAYNGTPDIRQVDIRANYITLDGFICHDAGGAGIDVRYTTGINISNCEIYGSVGSDGIYFWDAIYSIIDNCIIHDTGWNGIGIKPAQAFPFTIHHVIVKDCELYDIMEHNAFDVKGDYMTYENCSANNSLLAPMRITGNHNVINNFTGLDGNNGIHFTQSFWNSIILNCYLSPKAIIQSGGSEKNVIFYKNYLNYDYYGLYIYANSEGYNLIEENEIDTLEINEYTYGITGTGDVIIRNEVNSPYRARSIDGATITVEHTDGKVFTENGGSSPKWYPDKSNYTFNSGTVQFTDYNITLIPTTAYLKDVSVNQESQIGNDVTNITVNSSIAENPTWINATMQNASHTYNISCDGIYYDSVISDTNSIVRYYYNNATGNEWSTHDFEITWSSTEGWSYEPTHVYSGVLYRYCTDNTFTIKGRNPLESDIDLGNNFKVVVT